MWNLKVRMKYRGKAETCTFTIDPNSSLEELRGRIREELGLGKRNNFVIIRGFPPKRLDPSLKSQTLQESGIENADVLTLEQKTITATAAAAAETSSASAALKPKRKLPISRTSSSHPRIATISNPTARQPAKPRAPRAASRFKSKDDVSERLVSAAASAANSPQGRTAVSVFMRKVFRSAVKKQYDVQEGTLRFKAAISGDYRLEEGEPTARSAGTGEPVETPVLVHYKRGPRAWGEEAVSAYSLPLLSEVLRAVLASGNEEAREFLRPGKMAEVSPRVFWSLVKHFGGGLEDGLRAAVPEADWSFLNHRRRQLSERGARAQETLARQRPRKRRKGGLEVAAGGGPSECEEADNGEVGMEDLVEGEAAKWLAEAGVESAAHLADAGEELVGQAREAGVDLEGAVARAQELLVPRMFLEVVKEEKLVPELKEKCGITSSFDLFRLRVPGRAEFVVDELGGKVDVETVREWQKLGNQHLEDHPWLKYWRSKQG